jgi:hypothetical protein
MKKEGKYNNKEVTKRKKNSPVEVTRKGRDWLPLIELVLLR